ncbi:MAG TPA: hypothetical protein VKR61_05355 [Bryobacteraceae bacterium]|nr:hypothetical protein [Bryobacteraceae bacterium]
MSQPQPAQPGQPQYQISALYQFPVYATRAAYQQATGQQAPPFDSTRPLKGWMDPAPSGQPYNVFDATASATGYVAKLNLDPADAATLNLPGVYIYPAYVPAPTDAMEWGPLGPIGPLDPSTVCTQPDAQQTANEIAALYPGQVLSIQQENAGVYHIVYGTDPRRQWYIVVGAGSNAPALPAGSLIAAKYQQGVGHPYHWAMQPAAGSSNQKPELTCIFDTPVTAAPAGAVIMPAPIRPLLPNEQIVHLPGSLFSQAGTWVVERTDLPQPQAPETNDQQFADLKADMAAIQTSLGAIQTKLGA